MQMMLLLISPEDRPVFDFLCNPYTYVIFRK